MFVCRVQVLHAVRADRGASLVLQGGGGVVGGRLAGATAEGRVGVRRVSVAGDASTPGWSVPRPRRPAEGHALGGRRLGRRRQDRLPRQVDAQVAERSVPVRHRVTAQFHSRLKPPSNSKLTPTA